VSLLYVYLVYKRSPNHKQVSGINLSTVNMLQYIVCLSVLLHQYAQVNILFVYLYIFGPKTKIV